MQVVGAVSSWIDPDSPDDALRHASVSALKAQLGWAAHLGLQVRAREEREREVLGVLGGWVAVWGRGDRVEWSIMVYGYGFRADSGNWSVPPRMAIVEQPGCIVFQ